MVISLVYMRYVYIIKSYYLNNFFLDDYVIRNNNIFEMFKCKFFFLKIIKVNKWLFYEFFF